MKLEDRKTRSRHRPASQMKKHEGGSSKKLKSGSQQLAAHNKPLAGNENGKLQKRHVCPVPDCGKTFSKPSFLQTHLSTHDPDSELNTMLSCPICTKKVKKKSMRFHIRRHENETMISCPKCTKKVKKKSLPDHLRRHDIEKKYHCETCDKFFWTSNHLTLHMNTQHQLLGKKPEFLCDLCEFKTSHTEYLKSHVQRKHTGAQQCTLCDKKFQNEALLIKHSKKHAEKEAKIYKCEECDKSYTTSDGLRVHVNAVHKDINHICPYPKCTKSYNNISGLNYHVGTHDPAASELHDLFPCPICKQKFKRDYLRIHFDRHSAKNKRHKCDVCDEGFFSAGALKMHKISHMPPDRIACKFCEFKTAHLFYLQKHLKRKHSQIQEPFGCTFCEQRFIFKHNLTEHLKAHFEKNPDAISVAQMKSSNIETRSRAHLTRKAKKRQE